MFKNFARLYGAQELKIETEVREIMGCNNLNYGFVKKKDIKNKDNVKPNENSEIFVNIPAQD